MATYQGYNDQQRRLFLWTTAITCLLLTLLVATAGRASPYSDFFTLSEPETFSLTSFSSGFGSEFYDRTEEGFEFEQSLTRFVGLVGRVSAYQIYFGAGFDTPFPFAETATESCVNTSTRSPTHPTPPLCEGEEQRLTMTKPITSLGTVRNFGLFEGGIVLTPDLTFFQKNIQNTNIVVMAGRTVGDSDTLVIDVAFSTLFQYYTPNPIEFGSSMTAYLTGETINTSRMDLRRVMYSGNMLMLLMGAGGEVWGGGGLAVEGEAGPDISVVLNSSWRTRIDLQIGYVGNISEHENVKDRIYGLINVSLPLGNWEE
jgi:hypothetical protein